MKLGSRIGLYGVVSLFAVALLADLLASDLPILARIDGRLYLFPCVVRPSGMASDDLDSLRARLGPSDWLIAPPIPFSPSAQHPGGVTEVLSPPSAHHLLGTDDRGRDVLARLIHGTRVALAVGPPAVALYLVIGLVVGLLSAFGRTADLVLGRAIEVGLTFPTLFLLLAIQGMTAHSSLFEVGLAIALSAWPQVARLCRAEALRVLALPHIEAARGLGQTPFEVALRHVLPLAITPALVAAAFGVAQAVLYESALTFLGLGAPPDRASWGELLAQAQASGLKPWLLWPPTAAIAFTVVTWNLVGDSVRRRFEKTELG